MKTIQSIIIGLLALTLVYSLMQGSCSRKKIEAERDYFKAVADSCLHAPVKVDTVWRTERINDTIWLRYTQKIVDSVHVKDSVITKKEVTGIYNNEYFDLHWRALVFGELESMQIIPPSSYNFPTITETKTVTLPPVKIPCPNKWELWAYGDVGSFQFEHLDKFGTGLLFMKKRVALKAGFDYLYPSKQFLTSLGLAVKLR